MNVVLPWGALSLWMLCSVVCVLVETFSEIFAEIWAIMTTFLMFLSRSRYLKNKVLHKSGIKNYLKGHWPFKFVFLWWMQMLFFGRVNHYHHWNFFLKTKEGNIRCKSYSERHCNDLYNPWNLSIAISVKENYINSK